jgi:hypothetical protein
MRRFTPACGQPRQEYQQKWICLQEIPCRFEQLIGTAFQQVIFLAAPGTNLPVSLNQNNPIERDRDTQGSADTP